MMFIVPHLEGGKSPIILDLSHIVKITAAASGNGTAIELANGGGTVHVIEPYAEVRRILEPR